MSNRTTLPASSLVLLLGPPAAGKSHFAQTHFAAHEVIAKDALRLAVCNDVADIWSSEEAVVAIMSRLLEERLSRQLLTVVDAMHLDAAHRQFMYELARRHGVPVVVIVFDVPERVRALRNSQSPAPVPEPMFEALGQMMPQVLAELEEEPVYRRLHLRGEAAIGAASFGRYTSRVERGWLTGPFDIIGDIHGCLAEFLELLAALGYAEDERRGRWFHPEGRRLILLGDLLDRGPDSPGVVDLAMRLVEENIAICLRGNHEEKFCRHLSGEQIKMGRALQQTMAQYAALPEGERHYERNAAFVPCSLCLIISVSMAVGWWWHMPAFRRRCTVSIRQNPGSSPSMAMLTVSAAARTAIRFAAIGQQIMTVRIVVHGHEWGTEVRQKNNVWNIDTGCVRGGHLTALRYPEMTLLDVQAKRIYWGEGAEDDSVAA